MLTSQLQISLVRTGYFNSHLLNLTPSDFSCSAGKYELHLLVELSIQISSAQAAKFYSHLLKLPNSNCQIQNCQIQISSPRTTEFKYHLLKLPYSIRICSNFPIHIVSAQTAQFQSHLFNCLIQILPALAVKFTSHLLNLPNSNPDFLQLLNWNLAYSCYLVHILLAQTATSRYFQLHCQLLLSSIKFPTSYLNCLTLTSNLIGWDQLRCQLLLSSDYLSILNLILVFHYAHYTV